MTDVGEFQAKLKILSDAYAAQLPEKLKQIEQVWTELPRDAWDETGFENLHRQVHSLTGSGKTFGFASLSDAARILEDFLRQCTRTKTVLGAEQREHVQGLLQNIHEAAISRATSDMAGLVKITRTERDAEEHHTDTRSATA